MAINELKLEQVQSEEVDKRQMNQIRGRIVTEKSK